MRRRKHKQITRSLRHYRIQHGFRPPYKILADGNFLTALEAMKQGEAETMLSSLLGDRVRVFVTPCIRRELGRLAEGEGGDLGRDEAALAAVKAANGSSRRLALHACGHVEGPGLGDGRSALDGDSCLRSCLLSSGNGDHFFVATQDRSLQDDCAASASPVPVLYATANGLQLADPPRARAGTPTKGSTAATGSDGRRRGGAIGGGGPAAEGARARGEGPAGRADPSTTFTADEARRARAVADKLLREKGVVGPTGLAPPPASVRAHGGGPPAREGGQAGRRPAVQYRRNKAKGPNPLSARKKISKPDPKEPGGDKPKRARRKKTEA